LYDVGSDYLSGVDEEYFQGTPFSTYFTYRPH
jgi:hypothetical protein